jgi:hypothetical protein
VLFTLGAGDEKRVLLAGTIPPIPGSYELAAYVRVFTTEEHNETVHSDGARQFDLVEITGDE